MDRTARESDLIVGKPDGRLHGPLAPDIDEVSKKEGNPTR